MFWQLAQDVPSGDLLDAINMLKKIILLLLLLKHGLLYLSAIIGLLLSKIIFF
jgi:hypothetical protein